MLVPLGIVEVLVVGVRGGYNGSVGIVPSITMVSKKINVFTLETYLFGFFNPRTYNLIPKLL